MPIFPAPVIFVSVLIVPVGAKTDLYSENTQWWGSPEIGTALNRTGNVLPCLAILMLMVSSCFENENLF